MKIARWVWNGEIRGCLHTRHQIYLGTTNHQVISSNEWRLFNYEDNEMTIASDLLQQHIQKLVEDNARWQTLIADDILWELAYAPSRIRECD